MEDIIVSVSNFGPIEKGTVSVKPLTIFLGPNNTGKSYLAMLIHTFMESLLKFSIKTGSRPSVLHPLYFEPRLGLERPIYQGMPDELRKELLEIVSSQKLESKSVQLPEKTAKELYDFVLNFFESEFTKLFKEELERIFGCNISELCTHDDQPLRIDFEVNGRKFNFECKMDEFELKSSLTCPPIIPTIRCGVIKEREFMVRSEIDAKRGMDLKFSVGFLKSLEKEPFGERMILEVFTEDLLRHFIGFGWSYSFYLPAARSGILSAHKTLASGLLRQLPYVGLKRMEFLPLSGTITDFLANILQLEKRRGRLSEHAKFLEDKITHGKVEIKETEKYTYPEIFYEVKGLELPLHRSSSMVSEMAPLVLYLKYLVMPKSTLIIEEPESHLHPGAQRKLAQVLVRLVNSDVRIILTSHSDYLLHQIQNLVLIEGIEEDKRRKLKYGKKDVLDSNNVGIYLFKPKVKTGRTIINTINVLDTSMKDTGFKEVIETLYEESVKIDRWSKKE